MKAKLLVVVGNTTKREVNLRLPAVLGRSREADITVAHPLISRRHCELSEDNGLLMLRDLASLNGTMIGGRRVESAALLPKAEFTIGPLTFRVLYKYGGDPDMVPATCFIDEVQGTAQAGLGEPILAESEEVSMRGADEAMSAEVADENDSEELAVPDFMALADADIDEILPEMPAVPDEPAPAARRRSPSPQAACDKLATAPTSNVLDEPSEVDSSLQSGGYTKASPWSGSSATAQGPRPTPMAPSSPGPSAAPTRMNRRSRRAWPSRRSRENRRQIRHEGRRIWTTWTRNSAVSLKAWNNPFPGRPVDRAADAGDHTSIGDPPRQG